MKNTTIFTILLLSLLLISCNNKQEDAAKLQHHNDSLKTAIQIQTQQKQIDSLKIIQNRQAAKDKSIRDSIRQDRLNTLQIQLQLAKANVDADKATLTNVSQYHFGRLPSTREAEITDASNKLEQDKVLVQQEEDSIKKYQ